MILLNLGGIGGLIIFTLGVWFGPPLILTVIGISRFRENRKLAKTLFIMAVIYVLIGAGICASALTGLKNMGNY